jgi:hypothetical protein
LLFFLPLPSIFPSMPSLFPSVWMSIKISIVVYFFLSLLGFPLRPRGTKRGPKPTLLGRVVSWLKERGRDFLIFWLSILHGIMSYGTFYSLYGFVYLDFVVLNGSYKFVTSDVVCTCAIS